MKQSLGLLAASVMLAFVLAGCGGGKEKPPLTPDGPETEVDAGAGQSTLPHPDPK